MHDLCVHNTEKLPRQIFKIQNVSLSLQSFAYEIQQRQQRYLNRKWTYLCCCWLLKQSRIYDNNPFTKFKVRKFLATSNDKENQVLIQHKLSWLNNIDEWHNYMRSNESGAIAYLTLTQYEIEKNLSRVGIKENK